MIETGVDTGEPGSDVRVVKTMEGQMTIYNIHLLNWYCRNRTVPDHHVALFRMWQLEQAA